MMARISAIADNRASRIDSKCVTKIPFGLMPTS
jgi:hypothetical protein